MKKFCRKGYLARGGKRWLALLMSVCLIGTMIPITARAENGSTETGLCEHHTEHTTECGYVAPAEGQECGHVHDENCGYQEADECTHEHTEECGEDGENCTHVHDDECGYAEEHECEHVHDGECGYVEASEGSPCTFVCDICGKEAEPGENNLSEDETLTQTPEEAEGMLITAVEPAVLAAAGTEQQDTDEASVTINGETLYYATLEEAFSAAKGKTATITMLNDAECIDTTGDLATYVNQNSNITLNMNAKTLSGRKMGYNGIIGVGQGTLLVQGPGTVKSSNVGLSSSSVRAVLRVENITLDVSEGDNGVVNSAGTLILNNVQITGKADDTAIYHNDGNTIINNVSAIGSGYCDVRYGTKGTLKINGGTFDKISVRSDNRGGITSVSQLLGEGCIYRYADKTWETSELSNTLEISNVTVEKTPLTINPEAETSWYYNSAEHSLRMNAEPTTAGNEITYEWYDGDTKLECVSDAYTIPKTMSVGNYNYTCKATCDGYTLSHEFTFEIKQSGTVLDGIKAYNGDTETDQFFAGDTITIKAAPTATGEVPVSSMRKAARVNSPARGQMALFIGDTQVSEAVNAVDGTYTMEVSASDVLLQSGTEPNGTAIMLTAKFVGNDNMSDAEGRVYVNISAFARAEILDRKSVV